MNELLTDGDVAFVCVDQLRPPNALEPGMAAGAVNCRFERGQVRPRFGIAREAWGAPGRCDPVAAYSEGTAESLVAEISGLEVGRSYVFEPGNAVALASDSAGANPVLVGAGTFTATQTSYWAVSNDEQAGPGEVCTAVVRPDARTCGFARFSDPGTGLDCAVLVTDEAREDGGVGRAWLILPGSAPTEIPLNGHDVWGTCRLIQCYNSIVLLRHGDQRYYFNAPAATAESNQIALNVTPRWAESTARRVRFVVVGPVDSAGRPMGALIGASAPANGAICWAKHVAGPAVELYADASCTQQYEWNATATEDDQFYIEEAIDPAPWYGNAAQNLMAQPGADGETVFEAGFDAVPENVTVTGTDASSDILTAPNHRLQPGQQIAGTSFSGVTWGDGLWAAPQSEHTLRLYTSQEDALVDDGSTGLVDLTASDETGAIWPVAASAMPLPPCREGAYLNGRFVGIAGRDTIVVSDPMDPLHCALWTSAVAANLGDAGRANWIVPLGADAIAIGKDHNVLALTGLSGSSANWREHILTLEYNGIAPLAALQVATDVWFASRKGMASVIRTEAGQTLGVARPVSAPIPGYLAEVDWSAAYGMAAAVWNNRLFWAVPGKGQETPVNNRVLVFNFLNQTLHLQQAVVGPDLVGEVRELTEEARVRPDGWEGVWQGDLLQVHSFARLTIGGEERLAWATPWGEVCWFHDGWDDAGQEIEMELLSRVYFGGRPVVVLRGYMNWEHFNPRVTASVLTAGVHEEQTLSGFEELTYDRTRYLVDGRANYDPTQSDADEFEAPYRADFSPTPEETGVAQLDLHQNVSEPFCCRVRGVGPQVRLRNDQGSLKVNRIVLRARPVESRIKHEV